MPNKYHNNYHPDSPQNAPYKVSNVGEGLKMIVDAYKSGKKHKKAEDKAIKALRDAKKKK